MKNTNDINKLLSNYDRMYISARAVHKVTKNAKAKITNLWKKTLTTAKEKITVGQTKVDEIKTSVEEKTSTFKTNISDFANAKKDAFNNFMENEIAEAKEKENALAEVKYKKESKEIFKALETLKKSDLDEDTQKIYRVAAGKRLAVLENQYEKKAYSDLGVFSLAKLTAKKLKTTAFSKFKEKLETNANLRKLKKEKLKLENKKNQKEKELKKLEEMRNEKILLEYEIKKLEQQLNVEQKPLQEDSKTVSEDSFENYTNEENIVSKNNEENFEISENEITSNLELDNLINQKNKLEFTIKALEKRILEMSTDAAVIFVEQKEQLESELLIINEKILLLEESENNINFENSQVK